MMVDKFGNEIHIGDWVYYASKSKLTCLEIAKGVSMALARVDLSCWRHI